MAWADIHDVASALSVNRRSALTRVQSSEWETRPRRGRGGGHEYLIADMPENLQAKIAFVQHRRVANETPNSTPRPARAAHGATQQAHPSSLDRHDHSEAFYSVAWSDFRTKPTKAQEAAEEKLQALVLGLNLIAEGMKKGEAWATVEQETGLKPSTLARHLKDVRQHPRHHWLPLLVSQRRGRVTQAEMCKPAWDWFTGDYLRRNGPCLELSWENLDRVAVKEGWKIPCVSTFRNRLNREFSRYAITLAREGAEALRLIMPNQRRDTSVYQPGQAVSGDALSFDKLCIEFPDGEVVRGPFVWFFKDVRSGKILSHRIDKTENSDMFRLAFYDLTAGYVAVDGEGASGAAYYLPDEIIIDNTRAAANKIMTGQAPGRHRFTTKETDPMGLLVSLNVNVRFTLPDHSTSSPGTKPIERSFQGGRGLHDRVAKHPAFANRGIKKASPVSLAEFSEVLEEQIQAFNGLEGRRSLSCNGVKSFNQAWNDELNLAELRQCSKQQREMLLLIPEPVKANSKTGVISIQAGKGPQGRNEYFHELIGGQYAGKNLVAYIDPKNLHQAIAIHTLDGRYLCHAEWQPSAGFNSTEAGRQVMKVRNRLKKLTKAELEQSNNLKAAERAALLPALPKEIAAQSHNTGHNTSQSSNIVRPAFGAGSDRLGRAASSANDTSIHHETVIPAENTFGKGMQRIAELEAAANKNQL